MNNFEYNRSPTSLRNPSRLAHNANLHDRPRKPHRAMAANTSTRRPTPRPSRQAPPTLSNLPRFHPANFASYVNSTASSASSSSATSPESSLNSPQTPISPRSARQTPQLSEAQRQLYLYHRELFNLNRSNSGASSPGPSFSPCRPSSPNLRPLASPGAVTPLELEEVDQADGYLVAGINSRHSSTNSSKEEILESYIRREARGADAEVRLAR